MPKNKDAISYTLTVAFVLCVVCSVVVSTAAVMLRPAQESNKEKDFKKNILQAAGLYEAGQSIESQFSKVEIKIVDLSSGKFTDKIDPDNFVQRESVRDPELSTSLKPENDVAKLGGRMEKFAEVYLADSAEGKILILPVRGYGLWSTMRGFIALQSDYNTVAGLGFYEHGETPGLGGEIDNPRWKALWVGKEIYSDNGDVALDVIKGNVTPTTPNAEHKVDGLSGATLTSNGVDKLVEFWMGDRGYGPFLENMKEGDA